MNQPAPKKRNRLSPDVRAEIEAMAVFTPEELEQMKARSAEILRPYDRKAKAVEQRNRKRLSSRRSREHPNRGKTRVLAKGFWGWDEETPISSEEAQLPDYPALVHRSPTVTAKRQHRLRVWRFETSISAEMDLLDRQPPENHLFLRRDIGEERKIEADVSRRWTNAQRRIRKREKRRAAKVAAV